MIEPVECRGLEEPLELEGTHDEFFKCRNSKVKYTRDLLLELTEVEVCRKLPSDFDLSILRQLDEGSDATVEHKGIFGKPSDHSPLLTTNWNLAFPGKRWHSQSKDSHSQQNCSSEKRDVCQLLPQKSENDAGVLHREIPKTDSFQLSKTRNPYRPPHISKNLPRSLATFYEPGVESSGESDQKGSANDISCHGKSGLGFTLAVAKHSTNESLGGNEAFRRNNEGNELTEPSEPLGECEDLWVELSGESDKKDSAGDITGNAKSGYSLALEVADDSTKESFGRIEACRKSDEGNEVTEPSEPLDECEDFWRTNERNEVIGANRIVEGLMEDNQPTFEDFWAEILEIIHLQLEPNITGNAESRYSLALEVVDDSTKGSFGRIKACRKSNEGDEVTEPSEPLDECEDFWRTNKGNEVIGSNKILEGFMEDNQPTFDDFWAEILEIIHQQLEPNISCRNRIIHADSEVEIHFPDEESLTSVDPLALPQNSNCLKLDDSNAAANSEVEIVLPDEDSLISIHDMIAFDISMPTVNSGSPEAGKVTSKIAVDSRKSSKYTKFNKPNDQSKRHQRRAQPPLNFSRFATRGQLDSPLPYSLTSMALFVPLHPCFPPILFDPNQIPYIRCLNCFTQTDIHLPFCLETTLPNTNTQDSVSHYSLLHQPNIFLQQPSFPLFDTPCADSETLLSVYDISGMQFTHSTSQQAIHEGIGNSKAGK